MIQCDAFQLDAFQNDCRAGFAGGVAAWDRWRRDEVARLRRLHEHRISIRETREYKRLLLLISMAEAHLSDAALDEDKPLIAKIKDRIAELKRKLQDMEDA